MVSILQRRVGNAIAKDRAVLEATRANPAPARPASGKRSATSAPQASPRPAPAATDEVASPPAPVVACVDDYFATLGDRFVAEGSRGVDAVFQWNLSGDVGVQRYAVVSVKYTIEWSILSTHRFELPRKTSALC